MDPTFTVWHWTVSWHVVGLAVMLAVAYLALRVPYRMANQRLARAGQLAAGLYMTLVGLTGVGFAVICATRSPGWFDRDGLCNPGTLVLLAGILLLGLSVTLIATQHMARSDINFMFPLGWPAWFSGILAILSLCDLWFGGAGAHGWAPSRPDSQGAFAVSIATGIVAALLLSAWVITVMRSRSARATVGRALTVATFAATQQGILLVVHAASQGRIQAGGADIIISAAILAAAAFLAGMLVEDTATVEARSTRSLARAA
jgi:hypothetical protein